MPKKAEPPLSAATCDAIRRHWLYASSPVAQTIIRFRQKSGIRIVSKPKWTLLLRQLGPFYANAEAAIVAVVASLKAAVKALHYIVPDVDGYSGTKWEEVARDVHRLARLDLKIQDCDLPSLSWNGSCFMISLPKSRPINSPSCLLRIFKLQAPTILTDEASAIHTENNNDKFDTQSDISNPTTETPKTSPSPERGAEPAASVQLESASRVNDTHFHGSEASVKPDTYSATAIGTKKEQLGDEMPRVSSVCTVDELTLRPPYHLRISLIDPSALTLSCSHPPTVAFVRDYLVNWSRYHYNDLIDDGLNIDEHGFYDHGNAFYVVENRELSYSGFWWKLAMEASTGDMDISYALPVVFSLVEGVLGYQRIHTSDTCWQYRRDIPLKET